MKYRIVDENGEIQGELDTSEKWLPQLLERLMSITTLEEVARYTPTQITLLDQIQVLAKQSKEYPEYSAANSAAMCTIAATLENKEVLTWNLKKATGSL